MTQSATDICNLALSWLGEKPITGFSDQTRAAQLCGKVYEPLRDAVIEARFWRFAAVRAISESADRPGDQPDNKDFPAWGEGYVHAIPGYFLAVFRAYKDVIGNEYQPADWQREDEYIIADQARLYLHGVRSIEDTSKFSNLFVQALAARIAADLAIPITQNRSLQADMWTLYNDKMSEATVRDGQQGRSEATQSNRLLAARSR